eukprot:gnl/Carplike_NY0171/7088_a9782_170.p1 GENE.gnl/Carplike_NY0171/7088_a9782_170~~gnl/Carplike_NY0171/7088_a9782_170.p1  ORF type:complete len:364 (+),score=73.96 gnl/Carplike_NY0171/7088_a9782_170:98-1093(+)
MTGIFSLNECLAVLRHVAYGSEDETWIPKEDIRKGSTIKLREGRASVVNSYFDLIESNCSKGISQSKKSKFCAKERLLFLARNNHRNSSTFDDSLTKSECYRQAIASKSLIPVTDDEVRDVSPQEVLWLLLNGKLSHVASCVLCLMRNVLKQRPINPKSLNVCKSCCDEIRGFSLRKVPKNVRSGLCLLSATCGLILSLSECSREIEATLAASLEYQLGHLSNAHGNDVSIVRQVLVDRQRHVFDAMRKNISGTLHKPWLNVFPRGSISALETVERSHLVSTLSGQKFLNNMVRVAPGVNVTVFELYSWSKYGLMWPDGECEITILRSNMI